MRWDLVDRFQVLKKGAHARAVKRFTGDEDFFRENLPGRPMVPEPLFVEMIAQTGGVLYGLGFDFQKEVILAKIDDAAFPREVAPPCDFIIEAILEEEREEGAWVSGIVRHGREIAATARILLITMDQVVEGREDKVVFNKGFLKHYDVYNVARNSEVSI